MSRKLQNTPNGSCKSFKSCYSFPCILVHYHLENSLIKVTFIRTYGHDALCPYVRVKQRLFFGKIYS